MKRLAFLAVAGLIAAACQTDRALGPTGTDSAVWGLASVADHAGHYNLPAPGSDGIRVMTYNVYLGTNLGGVMSAQTPEQFLAAAAEAHGLLQATNFPERAQKIAEQIAEAGPDLVGLDEAAIWSVSSPYAPGGPPLAPFVVQYDFLQLVVDALAARGLTYAVGDEVFTSDVFAPVPTFDGSGTITGFILVHFQDRDAVLVRSGVSFTDPLHVKYPTYLPLDIQGTETGIFNGFASVLATVNGSQFRFVNTHLNAEYGPVNTGQALDLLGALQGEQHTVVLVGDINSGPESVPDFMTAYNAIVGAGFSDLWLMAHPKDPGLTNGSSEDLFAATLTFDKRIDLILVRDPLGPPEAAHASIFGDLPEDKTPSGLWPSDHAAVAAVFKLPTP